MNGRNESADYKNEKRFIKLINEISDVEELEYVFPDELEDESIRKNLEKILEHKRKNESFTDFEQVVDIIEQRSKIDKLLTKLGFYAANSKDMLLLSRLPEKIKYELIALQRFDNVIQRKLNENKENIKQYLDNPRNFIEKNLKQIKLSDSLKSKMKVSKLGTELYKKQKIVFPELRNGKENEITLSFNIKPIKHKGT